MSGAHVYNFTIGVDNILNRFQPIYIGKCFDKQQFYLYQVYSLLLDSLLLCFSAILAEVISGTLGHWSSSQDSMFWRNDIPELCCSGALRGGRKVYWPCRLQPCRAVCMSIGQYTQPLVHNIVHCTGVVHPTWI